MHYLRSGSQLILRTDISETAIKEVSSLFQMAAYFSHVKHCDSTRLCRTALILVKNGNVVGFLFRLVVADLMKHEYRKFAEIKTISNPARNQSLVSGSSGRIRSHLPFDSSYLSVAQSNSKRGRLCTILVVSRLTVIIFKNRSRG